MNSKLKVAVGVAAAGIAALATYEKSQETIDAVEGFFDRFGRKSDGDDQN